MDSVRIDNFMRDAWRYGESDAGTIIAGLREYIAIPDLSPGFDPEWSDNGHIDAALGVLMSTLEKLKAEWEAKGCRTGDIAIDVLSPREAPEMNPEGKRRSPLLVVDIPASGGADGAGTVLLYGHFDKQPGLEGQWSEGLGPRTPVIRDDKLYGRGGADDGYALFAAFSAVMAAREQGAPHARCVIIVEACEESSSADLPYYIETLRDRLGRVTLIVCLDSGCYDYSRLWTTNSLRGCVNGVLDIGVLREGVHSGDSSGMVPSCFRILRRLISRVEDEETGEVTPAALKVDISGEVAEGAKKLAAVMGDDAVRKYPFLEGVRAAGTDVAELILDRTWRTKMTIIGMDGIPPVAGSGNVMLPGLRAALSFRTPPTLPGEKAAEAIREALEKDPPYGAKVRYTPKSVGNGWAAPKEKPWLAAALSVASETYFGEGPMAHGMGGSIPFMELLGRLFPEALFMVTGVLGPHSNAHGPDEFLHIPTARKVAACVAWVLGAHAASAR